MPVLLREGRRLGYAVRGSGPPVVLIHGMASSGADWAFQVGALAGAFRVITPDLAGCGLSDPPPVRESITGFADDIWHLCDALGQPTVNVVGYSMGGAVALEMALRRPGRVPRLVLINGLASYRLDHWSKWFWARVDTALVRALGMRWSAQLIARRLFPDPWQKGMRQRVVSVVGSMPLSRYLAQVAALQGWSAMERLDALRSRVLLIAAQHDYTPLAEKEMLARQLRAPIIVVRGSRHGTPFDAIQVTNAALSAFLADQPLPPPAAWVRDSQDQAPRQAPEGLDQEPDGGAGRQEI